MSQPTGSRPALETSIPLVKGTLDRLPSDHARLAGLEALVLDRFALAGYERLNTPVLEPVDLHERKSGAGIVSKLFELAGHASSRVCLRPELTAGIVRAYTAAEPAPSLPWRVSHAGPAFRRESSERTDRLREFHQVGVERLGDSGAVSDAEVIWLADWTLAQAGVKDATIRLGHVGLTLEILDRSGLPPTAQAALVEMLSEAAAEGGDVGSIGRGLDHFSEWLRQGSESEVEEISLPIAAADDGGIDRLFRTLVPVITGRRPGHEIIHRLRRKWDLGHSWSQGLDRVRDQVRALADLKGPSSQVLDRLARDFEALAPDSVASIRALIRSLEQHGLDLARLELDLGFGRGIGFYSQMIFEILVPTPGGLVEVCGGGRYDGLARVLGSNRDDRGVGFAFGLERLDAVLEAQGHRFSIEKPSTFLVIPASSEKLTTGASVAASIRSRGSRAILEAGWEGQAITDRASAVGARWSVLISGKPDGALMMLLDHDSHTSRWATLEELLTFVADLDREEKS
jgi:histidyl-tRNA synthetase